MLRLHEVEVLRADIRAVVDVDLEVARGEAVALLGPSGAGKSSLLLAVAGLVDVAGGTIAIDGRDLAGVPPHRRGVGMVFQEYALFPHLSVAANIAYGLHGDGRGRGEHDAVVDGWLRRVGLAPATFRDRDVGTLSGGQRQRVALARALAPSPPVLLLDEPLGALDRQLREELLGELAAVVGVDDAPAVVVVTHDRDEAFTLGDRVGVMREGRLVQLDRPEALWRDPRDEWTARFLGHPNVLSRSDAAAFGLEARAALLPPAAVTVAGDDDAGVGLTRSAEVVAVAWRDGSRRATVAVDGVELVVELPGAGDPLSPGQTVPVGIDLAAARPLD